MEAGHRDPNPVTVASAEEETLKRNTDCVYFLASPLTCKKVFLCHYSVVHRFLRNSRVSVLMHL